MRTRFLGQKESKRWLTGLVDTEMTVLSNTSVVKAIYREGDIYEMLEMTRSDNSNILNGEPGVKCLWRGMGNRQWAIGDLNHFY